MNMTLSFETRRAASVSGIVYCLLYFCVFTPPSVPGASLFQKVGGPYEGNVAGFGIDHSNILYVAGNGSGVFRSTDPAGTNWSVFGNNADLPDTVLQSLGVDPSTTPATLYAGSQIGSASGNAPLYRSADGGNTWTWFNSGLPNFSPFSFAYETSTGDMFVTLFGGAGLYRLPQGSTNWTACGTGLANGQATVAIVNPTNGDVYFFNYGDGKAYRSTNNGASFTAATVESGNKQVYTLALDSSVTPPYLYAAVRDIFSAAGCDLQTAGGLYRSTDSGGTWQQVGAASLPAFPNGIGALATDANGRVYAGIGNADTGYGALYVSSDHGQTFSQDMSAVLTNIGSINNIFVESSSTIYAGADGVYRGTERQQRPDLDLAAFDQHQRPVAESDPKQHLDRFGRKHVCGNCGGGVSVSRDFGNTWTHINGSGASRLGSRSVQTVLVEPHTHYLYAMVRVCVPDALWRSTDQGITWSPVSGYSTSYNGQGVNAAIHTTNGIYNIIGGCRWAASWAHGSARTTAPPPCKQPSPTALPASGLEILASIQLPETFTPGAN